MRLSVIPHLTHSHTTTPGTHGGPHFDGLIARSRGKGIGRNDIPRNGIDRVVVTHECLNGSRLLSGPQFDGCIP